MLNKQWSLPFFRGLFLASDVISPPLICPAHSMCAARMQVSGEGKACNGEVGLRADEVLLSEVFKPFLTGSLMPCPVGSFQNCLIRLMPRGREALVTDFGLAREVVELPVKDVERKLSLVGSAFWMAPEMLRGEPYDRKVWHCFPAPCSSLELPNNHGTCLLCLLVTCPTSRKALPSFHGKHCPATRTFAQ